MQGGERPHFPHYQWGSKTPARLPGFEPGLLDVLVENADDAAENVEDDFSHDVL